ncbi:MAG: GAF domain-containing sensor histidine kinase [Nitrospirales bacterium]|nr:GAF domain-containing sensor histidine kinase [Nitrospirales bacterium]
MLFRPFGKEPSGETIRDLSGVSIRANVEYLEEAISRVHGAEAGKQAVEKLVTLLNERISDHAYHVTADFLKNPWTGYSNEFVAYLVELCVELSGDPEFQFNMGRKNLISPIIQTLMRPFSTQLIFKAAARWVQHYNKNSYKLDTLHIDDHSAVMRMTLTERACQHFGPYRKACGKVWCNALKIGIAMVPKMVHNQPEAIMKDIKCLAEGDEFCEWEVTWTRGKSLSPWRKLTKGWARRILDKEIQEREKVINEQLQSLETRHEEIHEAYLELQQNATELQRRVDQLTALHEAGLAFISTLDQDTLLRVSMGAIIKKLPYDRVMIQFFDSDRRMAHSARIVGVSSEVEKLARNLEIPVTDPNTVEGRVLLRGQPVLIKDVSEVWDQLHPFNRDLALQLQTKAFISVPLKVRESIIGSLTVDRTQSYVLHQEDLDLMGTLGNLIAISLDHARAYQQIEELNLDLENKVQKRTIELERANEQLQEMDRLKTQFLSHVSHDLRTPLTAIRGLATNLLEGTIGALTNKQSNYLDRINSNVERLTRMISDLLDLSSITAGKLRLNWSNVDVPKLAREMVEQVQLLAEPKDLTIAVVCPEDHFTIVADYDRLCQVILNLLDNAIKFTPQGGNIRLEVKPIESRSTTIIVSDSGPGIPQESISNLFDPFYQAHPQLEYRKKGLGIGLAIVKNFVDLHGGTIQVESELGKGTTFRISLPISQEQP